MIVQQEWTFVPTDEVPRHETPDAAAQEQVSSNEPSPAVADVVSTSPLEVEVAAPQAMKHEDGNGAAGLDVGHWHAQAGRKGARRVHQLIQEGKLYEQEHGLKRGRQRLRQLIELGKVYEQEHGLRPRLPKKRGERLSRMGREELLATFLQCLLRITKSSFREELLRLTEALQSNENDTAG